MLSVTLVAAALALVLRKRKKARDERKRPIKRKRTHRYWERPWIKCRDKRDTLYDLRIEIQVRNENKNDESGYNDNIIIRANK